MGDLRKRIERTTTEETILELDPSSGDRLVTFNRDDIYRWLLAPSPERLISATDDGMVLSLGLTDSGLMRKPTSTDILRQQILCRLQS